MEVKFGKQIKKWLETTDVKVNKVEENQKKLVKDYAEICDKLMLTKADEKRSKSDKFAVFFVEFIDQI